LESIGQELLFRTGNASTLESDGSYGKVQSVKVIDHAQVMYNLTVHDDHDYFVGSEQWLVHNLNTVCIGCLTSPFTKTNSAARAGNAAQNFAILWPIALNLLKHKTSLKAAWSEAYLLKVLGI